MHFYGGAVGRLGHPHVEVFSFAGFEEEDVVAVVEFLGGLARAISYCMICNIIAASSRCRFDGCFLPASSFS